jgi:hypothetical protein
MLVTFLSLALFMTLLVGETDGAPAPNGRAVSEVQHLIEQVMALSLSRSEGLWGSSHAGKERHATILKATREYPAGVFPEEELHPALRAAGWAIDYKFSTSTPNDTAFAYRKDRLLCIFQISWSPGHVDYEGLTEQQKEKLEKVPHTYQIAIYAVGD